MKIKQHIPDASSGFKAAQEKFGTLNELLKIDFVARWEENAGFYQFSIAKKEKAGSHHQYFLMVELDQGNTWYVVGYISGANINKLALPQWHAPGTQYKDTK